MGYMLLVVEQPNDRKDAGREEGERRYDRMHVDFSVPKHFIEKGFNRLAVGGSMWLVTKRLPWYKNKLRAIFGGSRVHELDGYYVFEAVKTNSQYASAGRKAAARAGR